MGSELFQALREHGQPTYYGENKWPVTADKVIYAIIFCFLALAFSFYVTLIGVRGVERVYSFIRMTTSLFIGAVILVCNFGYGWERGSVIANVTYKAFTSEKIKAEIGVNIGFRGINVTLVGIPKTQLNSIINYNERFSWQWSQGKPGYGPTAGRLNREYKAAKIKGLPFPILWTVDYFTVDEGNFRHGRYYRSAGWFCHIALWTAVPLWLLSNILFYMVIRYGAYYLALTGCLMILTCILFANIRNPVPVELRFDSKPLTLSFGWCFYLVLFTGILCIVLATIVLFMDLRFPEELATFFGVDVLQDYEDFYADPADLGLVPPIVRTDPPSSSIAETSYTKRLTHQVLSLRKRTLATRFQRSPRKSLTPSAPSRQYLSRLEDRVSELPVYENINLTRFDPIGEEEDEETKEGSHENIIRQSPRMRQ